MAIDYKGLRNLLDSSPNQTKFAQTIAQQFLEPLFKKKTDIVTSPTLTNSNPGGGGGSGGSQNLNQAPQDPALKKLLDEAVEVPSTTVTFKNLAYGDWDYNSFNPEIGRYGSVNYQGKNIDARLWGQEGYNKTYDATYTYRGQTQQEVRDMLIRDYNQQQNPESSGNSAGTVGQQETYSQSTVLEYNYLDAQKAAEADLRNIEKYVSPTAAKGLRSLLDSLYQGNVPADVLARMQREGFDPQSEAFKLITQNPLDFKGVASYGGITTGFKAADLQEAQRIDTKKILASTTDGDRFRRTVAQEISKVVLNTSGAKQKGQGFMLDARFDANAEKQILAGLKEDLSKVARQSGKYGSGLTRYIADMYSSIDSAKGYQGSVASLAAGKGENLRGYRDRLANQQEILTPKNYLAANSKYLREDKFAQNTRSVVNGFLQSLSSPLSIGF